MKTLDQNNALGKERSRRRTYAARPHRPRAQHMRSGLAKAALSIKTKLRESRLTARVAILRSPVSLSKNSKNAPNAIGIQAMLNALVQNTSAGKSLYQSASPSGNRGIIQ